MNSANTQVTLTPVKSTACLSHLSHSSSISWKSCKTISFKEVRQKCYFVGYRVELKTKEETKIEEKLEE